MRRRILAEAILLKSGLPWETCMTTITRGTKRALYKTRTICFDAIPSRIGWLEKHVHVVLHRIQKALRASKHTRPYDSNIGYNEMHLAVAAGGSTRVLAKPSLAQAKNLLRGFVETVRFTLEIFKMRDGVCPEGIRYEDFAGAVSQPPERLVSDIPPSARQLTAEMIEIDLIAEPHNSTPKHICHLPKHHHLLTSQINTTDMLSSGDVLLSDDDRITPTDDPPTNEHSKRGQTRRTINWKISGDFSTTKNTETTQTRVEEKRGICFRGNIAAILDSNASFA
ncbi:hypothetical protein HYFRA_00009740 [Hymenoscyphus fraxineus]|uniref:Uncharacterized protein n=1 Tax=Hymenoscyphus fraxineus TaxID=746836 RepID=A0A9N9KTZ4_9HELO|nr:hypothetical protein HYFRA_00009740 [Hymenoscyphus fraxineus]